MSVLSYTFQIVKDTKAIANEVMTNFNDVKASIENDMMHADGTNPTEVPLILPGPPTNDNEAATKGYVDSVFPVSSIIEFAGDELPDGTTTDPDWAWPDGSTQSITDPRFTALYNKIGITYGGDGVTNFQLPDKRQRVTIGANGVEYVAGQTGGSADLETHQHAIEPHKHTGVAHKHTMPTHIHTMPNHTHTANHNHPSANTGGSGYSITTSVQTNAGLGTGLTLPSTLNWDNNHVHSLDLPNLNVTTSSVDPGNTNSTDPGDTNNATSTVNNNTAGLATGDTGTGDGGNLPPYLALNHLIKL